MKGLGASTLSLLLPETTGLNPETRFQETDQKGLFLEHKTSIKACEIIEKCKERPASITDIIAPPVAIVLTIFPGSALTFKVAW